MNSCIVMAACVWTAGSGGAEFRNEPPSALSNNMTNDIAIDWAHRPAIDALRELADGAGLPLWLDGPAQEVVAPKRLTLRAQRIRRIDALRRVARLASAECLVLPDRLAVVARGTAPAAWTISDAWRRQQWGGDDHRVLARPADLRLTDVTLTRFCQSLEDRYQVDVAVDPALQNCQQLLSLEGDGIPLQSALDDVSQQLKASAAYADGVVVIEPRPPAPGAISAATETTNQAATAATSTPRPRARLRLDGGPITWDDLSAAAAQKSYDFYLPRDLRGVRIGAVTADGDVASVVQAVLLSEGWILQTEGGRRWAVRAVERGQP